MQNVYSVPLVLEEAGLGDIMLDSLGLRSYRRGIPGSEGLDGWRRMVQMMDQPKDRLPIALVGKYVEYPDSYLSVREALRHAGLCHTRDVELQWVHSEDIERHGPDDLLRNACGIALSCPAASAPAASRGWLTPCATPASTRSPTSASASDSR